VGVSFNYVAVLISSIYNSVSGSRLVLFISLSQETSQQVRQTTGLSFGPFGGLRFERESVLLG
jgi:hypothetical protein